MLFYNLSIDETLKKLGSHGNGLTVSEVKKYQKKFGENIIKIQSEPLWRKIIEPFADIFSLVLMLAAIVSIIHNEIIDAVIIIIILVISAIIFYVQRFSTDRVLRSLSRHDAQKIDVLRSGKIISIDSSKLVPGDIVNLSEGEKVPADIRLMKAINLRIDESQLTGESIPISKNSDKLDGEQQIYERTNMLFQGSFVVSGMATGVVTAIGNQTEFGNLASLSKKEITKSPVQQKIDKLIARIITIISAVGAVAFCLSLLRGMDVLDSLRFVIALSVSAVPESLPIAISVVLVLGMRRMAKKKALVHQMRAIETIGVITTIATDKTGTLTKNLLTVQETWTLKKHNNLPELMTYFVNHGDSKSHDPLDIALDNFSRKNNTKTRGLPAAELPFNQEFSMSATIWHNGVNYKIYYKGAPEEIIKRCKLTTTDLKLAKKSITDLTSKGYRVVGLATSENSEIPTDFSKISHQKLQFTGLVAVADVLRPEASRAIKSAISAGVSVRMITGDHFETAYQIGKKLGMVENREEVFDCREMSKMTDDQLDMIIKQTKVFSRVIPEQKYRILTILKHHNITAMTGDGVNDVPALSGADVGIAMGSGSHIAKDAGAIILLDDNFKTIIDAMREGRTIIANIRRMLFYLLSTNTGELITMIGALLIGIKTPLEPVQILWVNLVTDTSMVIPLGLEPAEKNIMKQLPKNIDAPILDKVMVWRMAVAAGTMAAIALITYVFFEKHYGHNYTQTLAFISLVVSQWANAFNARSDQDSVFTRLKVMNRSFYVGMMISLTLQTLVLFGPLGEILHIHKVDIAHIVVVNLLALTIPIATSEIHKWWTRRKLAGRVL